VPDYSAGLSGFPLSYVAARNARTSPIESVLILLDQRIAHAARRQDSGCSVLDGLPDFGKGMRFICLFPATASSSLSLSTQRHG